MCIIGSLTAHDEENGGALRMANVLDLWLVCVNQNMINGSGHIKLADLVEGEVPVLIRLEASIQILAGVYVATGIQHPDVVTLAVKDIC